MSDPTFLATITAKLEEADAILSSTSTAPRRLAAVRTLLRPLRSSDMPTKAARALWIEIVAILLSVGAGAGTKECEGLGTKIRQLRTELRKHRAVVLYL